MRTLPIELLREFRKGFFSLRHLIIFELSSQTIRWTDADVPIYGNIDGSSQWYGPKGIKFEPISTDISPAVDHTILTIGNAKQKVSDIVLNEDIRNRPVYIYRAALDKNMDVAGSILIFPGLCDTVDPVAEDEVKITISNIMIKWARKTLRTHDPGCCWIFRDTETCLYIGANDVNTTIKTQANAGATTIDVQSTSGMNTVDSKISIVLDDGNKHWSRILTIVDADTITIKDGIPTGRYAPVGAAVKTMRWCDHSRERCIEMGNQKNFSGFSWLSYLEDKSIWWGRSPK